MKSACLFGGSFDPVHTGHLLVARAAREELDVEQVIFIPAARSPFKLASQPAPPAARLQMLRTALAGRTWTAIDEQEISRGGVSYTVNTLRDYRKKLPEIRLCYLVGEDNVAQLIEWREPAELARLAEFVVIPRPLMAGAGQAGNAATAAGAEKARAAGFKLRFLKGFPLGVSSSEIRDRVRAGLPVEDLLPPGVPEIIRNNGLYL